MRASSLICIVMEKFLERGRNMEEPRCPSCALGMVFGKFGVPSGLVVCCVALPNSRSIGVLLRKPLQKGEAGNGGNFVRHPLFCFNFWTEGIIKSLRKVSWKLLK